MRITGTFLDEISYDIPHQNWGKSEWDQDFQAMKAIGIDTVILIRCGLYKWLTYPSRVLEEQENCIRPPLDLVDMFLDLAEAHGMRFYFGTYDSGNYWAKGQYEREVDLNLRVVDEVWAKYGQRAAFAGWYLTQEVSRGTRGIIDLYARMGRHCKEISGNLPTLISPYIDGVKVVSGAGGEVRRSESVTLNQHEKEWDEVFEGIRGIVDAVAFQDGHVDFQELPAFLEVNRRLGKKHGVSCWTNCESFDRDMPIRFPPIKWEKLLLKLEAAREAGMDKAITFEFSHFMSPNSIYPAAANLYRRYCEHFNIA